MISAFNGGALRPITSFKLKIAGALRTIRTASVFVGGDLEPFYSTAAALSVSAPNVGGAHHGTVTTDPSTMTPVGGAPPYSYAWTNISGSGNTPTINSPAFATSTFTQTDAGSGGDLDIWTERGTVTDSLGATATVDISVSFQHLSAGGGGQ